jgi:uncharacterized Zn-finger protein
MEQLISEIFEETPADHFSNDFCSIFDPNLNWYSHQSAMLPSPQLSGQYTRSGSQTSVEGFQPVLSDSHLPQRGFRFFSEGLKKAGNFECPFPGCSKTFTRKDNIKYHLKTHDQHRDRPFSCDQCNKSYFRAIDLTRHIRVSHEKVKAFNCHICCQSYTRKEALKRHMEKKHFE